MISSLGKIRSEAIVPELADLLLRIDGVSWALCMGELRAQMIISLRCTSRKHKAGAILRRLIGKMGSAGGHRGMAGGQIPLGCLSKCDRHDLPDKLISRFLALIDRQSASPQLLVQPQETQVTPKTCLGGSHRQAPQGDAI